MRTTPALGSGYEYNLHYTEHLLFRNLPTYNIQHLQHTYIVSTTSLITLVTHSQSINRSIIHIPSIHPLTYSSMSPLSDRRISTYEYFSLVCYQVLVPTKCMFCTYTKQLIISFAIDHRRQKIEVPVRSPVLKPPADWLVVGWVTTSESQLLIVFVFRHF